MTDHNLVYENNYATQLAEEEFSVFDFDYKDIPGKDYIESLNVVTTFYDYTYFYAQKNGFNESKSDADALANFVYNLGITNNAPLSSFTTVKNWLKKAPPSGNQTGRENVYLLCFALKLNAKETKEFFLKAYLERPFNYKNIHEAVYYFCMNNGLSYMDANRIIAKIESMPIVENKNAENITEQIGNALSLITAEDDAVKYIVNNRSGFALQNQTATNRITALIDECMCLGTTMRIFYDHGKYKAGDDELYSDYNQLKQAKSCCICGKTFFANGFTYRDNQGFYCSPNCFSNRKNKRIENVIESIDDLLNEIQGYDARATYKGDKIYDKSINKSRLPDEIRSNFPQREQIKQIKAGKASYDTIRKALIMFKFYHFFADAFINNAENFDSGLFDEFVNETNELLSECGYVQLYWRNPYDWIFGYCAWAPNPIDEFKNIIYEYYLRDFDED